MPLRVARVVTAALFSVASTASVAALSCGGARTGENAPTSSSSSRTGGAGQTSHEKAAIELVESVPVETKLDHDDVRDAYVVWPEMIAAAKRTIDFAEFYASEAEGDAQKQSRLAPIIVAVEQAVARKVRVRFLADATFAKKYPETLDRLKRAGIDVRLFDVSARAGGILHAKYFVVDGRDSFVGSQNFDWRALAHIQEMGIRVHSTVVAGALLDVYETDWSFASGATNDTRKFSKTSVAELVHGTPNANDVATTDGSTLTFAASPKGWLPNEASWDLPRLVALLDGAKRAIDLQVLTYSTKNRDGSPFTTLDDAIRRAAKRGVPVRLLVSSWAEKAGSHSREALDALGTVPNVSVRVITIPPFSGGEIPFARVAHAKYLVVDGETAWLGTSNWEGDYFLKSRNVGFVIGKGSAPTRLAKIFEDGWGSPLTKPLAP